MTIYEISEKLKHKPLFIHINPIGLLRLDRTNIKIYEKFNYFLNEVQNNGGNIAIPTYSYSYTKKEKFDIKNTPSMLDEVSEYLRKMNNLKRTVDANFSYLLFGNGFSNKHLVIDNYNSFGEGSLIEEVFLKDGYLGAVGGALEYLTEIHFLEKKLSVDYRFDKEFSGEIIDHNGFISKQNIIYYCRDLKSDYDVSFVQLKEDLKKNNLIEIWHIDEYNLKIEVIEFKVVYDFIKKKLIDNKKYLWKRKI